MGCGTVHKVIIPSNEPKWSDESIIQFPLKLNNSAVSSFFLLSDIFWYCIRESNFSCKPVSLPVKECGFLCIGINKFLIAGGYSVLNLKDSSSCYVFENMQISSFPSLIHPTRRLKLLQHDSKIYAVGGVRESFESNITLDYSNNFSFFNSETWISLPDMPYPVEYPSCYAYSDKIYVIGGCVALGLELVVVDYVRVFDVKVNEWSLCKMEVPEPVYGHLCVEKDSTGFLLLGGLDCDSENSSMSFIVGKDNFEEICPVDVEISTFFPFSSAYDQQCIYVVNDKYQVLCLNRLERKWGLISGTES
jgi:hypothetical protein